MEQELKYKKTCLCCKHEYRSNARGQRFCSEACRVRYNKRLKDNHRFYSETKELMRIKARSHALAVEVKAYLSHSTDTEPTCEHCGATGVELEVHHRDLNFLNNTPSNLVYLCKKCHSEEHSRVEKEGKVYDESFLSFMQPIMKSKKLHQVAPPR